MADTVSVRGIRLSRRETRSYMNERSFRSSRDIDEIKKKREALEERIEVEIQEQSNLMSELESLRKRMTFLDDSLSKNIRKRAEYDRVIQEIEADYNKILDNRKVYRAIMPSHHPKKEEHRKSTVKKEEEPLKDETE